MYSKQQRENGIHFSTYGMESPDGDLVLQLKFSSAGPASTKHYNSMGKTRKFKNTVGPGRRPIRIYFKPTCRRAKGGWGGGCYGRLSRHPSPREKLTQPQGFTERREKRRDLTETRDGLDQGNPLAAPFFCMTMEKALKKLEQSYPEMKTPNRRTMLILWSRRTGPRKC